MAVATRSKLSFSAVVDRDPLLAAMARVRGVVERRSTIPILVNVKLTAGGGKLTLTATDLDIEMIEAVACDGTGEITTNAEHLLGLIQRTATGAQLALDCSDEDPRLVLKAGRSTYRLPVLPATDFPVFDADGLGPEIVLDTDQFAGLFNKTDFAMSTEETRYYLNGVYLHPIAEGGSKLLRMVATDGHRLAIADMPAPDVAIENGVIIPRKTTREMMRLLTGAGETVKLRLSAHKVQLQVRDTVITSKIIDGNYPPYERVVPADNPNVLVINKTVLASCIERAMVISTQRTASIRLELEPTRVLLTIRNMEAGQGAEEIEASYSGPRVEVGFNARYLLDVISRLEADDLEMHVGAEPRGPVPIVDQANAAARFVIMPLTV